MSADFVIERTREDLEAFRRRADPELFEILTAALDAGPGSEAWAAAEFRLGTQTIDAAPRGLADATGLGAVKRDDELPELPEVRIEAALRELGSGLSPRDPDWQVKVWERIERERVRRNRWYRRLWRWLGGGR